MSRVNYTAKALDDLDAIFDIVGSDYPQRGFDYVQKLRERCRKNLLPTPKLGPARSDLGDGIRIYPIKSMRALIAYRIGENEIIVVRVFYGAPDYEAILAEMADYG